MDKKYLETKNNSLESSVLGVWKTAIEEGDARMDGRTKEYREHRKKLESTRSRRVNKEEVELYKTNKLPNMRDALMQVRTEKHDTHVDPEDREELDKAPSDTAKKMKKAKEPAPNQVAETNKNDKSDDGEGLDSVQPKAVKKKFKDRKDKDSDNDGDVDDSDKFLHKRRKAVSKAISKEEVDLDDNAEEYAQTANFKIQSMKAALAQVWGMEEGHNPFAEHKGTKPHKHPHEEDTDEENEKRTKTETGKKPAVIDLKPKIEN